MAGSNSIEDSSIDAILSATSLSATPLTNQQFRLNKINEIKDYFIVEVKER